MKSVLAIAYILALVVAAVALGNASCAAGNPPHCGSALTYLGVFH
jgi:hypothetical protein